MPTKNSLSQVCGHVLRRVPDNYERAQNLVLRTSYMNGNFLRDVQVGEVADAKGERDTSVLVSSPPPATYGVTSGLP